MRTPPRSAPATSGVLNESRVTSGHGGLVRSLSQRSRWHRPALALLAGATLAAAGCASLPDHPTPPPANAALPAALQVAPDAVLQEALEVHGQEVYVCRRGAAGLAWVDHGSEATLVDAQRRSVGMVTSNNYFIGDDDSYLIEHVVAERTLADDTLAWRLSRAVYNASPGHGDGRFARVSAVQRVQTTGGLPPDAHCQIDGQSLYVPYGAVYLLYRDPGAAPLPPMTKPRISAWLAAVPRQARAATPAPARSAANERLLAAAKAPAAGSVASAASAAAARRGRPALAAASAAQTGTRMATSVGAGVGAGVGRGEQTSTARAAAAADGFAALPVR